MPKEERPDEAAARRIVESECHVHLEFADLTGGVDYLTLDNSVALEVTRFTDGLLRRDMAVASGADHVTELGTGYDWHVTFDGYPRYDGLAGRLYPPLHVLETHGLEHWDPARMAWWAQRVETLREAVVILAQERVVDAQARLSAQRPTRLFVSTSGGWTYGGPDAALEVLEAAIAADSKHLDKLQEQAAQQRQLWIWTDVATTGSLRRAFSPEEQRLPSRPPDLPSAVTHLWCVDEGHNRGWAWWPDRGWFSVTVDSGPEPLS